MCIAHGYILASDTEAMTSTAMPAMLVGITTSGDDKHDGIE